MQRMSLRQVIQRSTPYETWRAPLHPTLRHTAWISGAILLLQLLVVACQPLLLALADSWFFLLFSPLVQTPLLWLHAMQLFWLLVLSGFGLLYVLLGLLTRGFQDGRAGLHWATASVILAGTLLGLALTVMLFAVILNLIIWLGLLCIALLGMLGVLSLLFRRAA
ncbi:MAG: hypothetical protein MUD01_01185 [Chloroflexaceae bacterium]|nr:hypothetical protein [Chloroflexaceae bacterium]